MKTSLGARLYNTRKKKGITHNTLAQAVGVSARTIANYEANRTKPDRDRLYALAAALDVPVSSIVGRTQEQSERTPPITAPETVAMQVAMEVATAAPEQSEPEHPAETLYEIVNRLCDGSKCEDCIIGHGRAETERLCTIIARGVDVEAVIAEIRQWAVENPPAYNPTYCDDFFEKFPDAPRREDGAPLIPIEYVYRPITDTRQAEFKGLTHKARWNKPLGYWSQCES